MTIIRLEGATTANKVLRHLEFKVRRNIVTAAVRAGCGEIRKEARALAPVDTGTMRKQLAVSVKMERDASGRVVGQVKPKRTKAQRRKGAGHSGRYIHLVVGGTRPHVIRPSKTAALVLAFGPDPVQQVAHPGARPQPFMERAANSSMRRALIAFSMKLDQRISQECAKTRAMT